MAPAPRLTTPSLADIALTLVAAASSIGPQEGHAGGFGKLNLFLALAGSLPVLLRRSFPLAVLAVVETAQILIFVTVGINVRGVGLGLAVAIYTVARTYDRRTSLRLALAVAALNTVVMLVAAAAGRPGDPANVIPGALVLAGSWGIGDNIRTRRAYLASVEERASRAEREREASAQRAVLDERTRIARELHDVVAHHVSAIAVTAGAAAEVATEQPDRAEEALRTIQATSRQALGEMRAMVGVLEGGAESAGELTPQPGLAQVERLLAQTRAAGLEVSLRVEGRPRELPAALDLTAYRIVQEALTNTLRHAGSARAEVTIRYGDEALELAISDDGRGEAPAAFAADGSGRGLVGMRERVALFHGEMSAGPSPRGGYLISARLPLTGMEA